jgi:hypothetical protein
MISREFKLESILDFSFCLILSIALIDGTILRYSSHLKVTPRNVTGSFFISFIDVFSTFKQSPLSFRNCSVACLARFATQLYRVVTTKSSAYLTTSMRLVNPGCTPCFSRRDRIYFFYTKKIYFFFTKKKKSIFFTQKKYIFFSQKKKIDFPRPSRTKLATVGDMTPPWGTPDLDLLNSPLN